MLCRSAQLTGCVSKGSELSAQVIEEASPVSAPSVDKRDEQFNNDEMLLRPHLKDLSSHRGKRPGSSDADLLHDAGGTTETSTVPRTIFLAGATIDDRAESLRLTQEALDIFREQYANDPLLYLVVFNQYSRSRTMLKCSTPLKPLRLLS